MEMASSISRGDDDGDKKNEKEKGKEKPRSKEEQSGQGQEGKEQEQKGQETIRFRTEPVPGISKQAAKKCCCVDFLAAVSSPDKIQEQKNH